jgi:hypothetical protein
VQTYFECKVLNLVSFNTAVAASHFVKGMNIFRAGKDTEPGTNPIQRGLQDS